MDIEAPLVEAKKKRKSPQQVSDEPAKPHVIENLKKAYHYPKPVDYTRSEQSLGKHGESLRFKAAHAAHNVADELLRTLAKPGKQDKEYVKGLVWSFGVLFDKVAGAVSNDAVVVRIPARLLDAVSIVLGKQAAARTPVVVNEASTEPAQELHAPASAVPVEAQAVVVE